VGVGGRLLPIPAKAYSSRYLPMLSPTERERVKNDLGILKKAYEESDDSGIRQVIRDWILDAEKMLEEEAKKSA
jgi:hypothetical protein